MREMIFEDGKKVVKSPWLRPAEAAAYCGISRSTFDERASAVNLPHGGDSRLKLYHTEVLDRWIGGVLDVPFFPEPIKPRQRRFRMPIEDENKEWVLVNPVNGKVYRG